MTEGRGGPKISRFICSLPPEISFFLLSLGFLVEFWWLRVFIALVVDAVVGLMLGLIGHVVVIVFVVAFP